MQEQTNSKPTVKWAELSTLARARVVIGHALATSPRAVKYMVASILSLAIVAFIGILVLFQFSPYPLLKLADSLRADGFEVGKIKGSVSTGFLIERLSYSDDRISIALNGLLVKPGESSRNAEGEPVIAMKAISADSMAVKFLNWTPFKGETPEDVVKTAVRPWFSRTSRGLVVGSFETGDVSVEVMGREPFRLKRVHFTDFSLRTSNSSIGIGRISGHGDGLQVEANNVFAEQGKLRFVEPAHLEIKPEFSPEVLDASIDLQIEGTIDGLHPSDLKLTTFNGKLRFDWHEEGGELRLTGFAPQHFVKTEIPFWNIDLNVAADNSGPLMDRIQGRVSLRGTNFVIDPPHLVYKKGVRVYTIAPRMTADVKSMLTGREPGFTLGSSDRMTAREALADIYFSKSVVQLSPSETEILDKDMRFFADTADAGVVILTQDRVLKSVEREPAATKKKSKLKPKKPGLPKIKKNDKLKKKGAKKL